MGELPGKTLADLEEHVSQERERKQKLREKSLVLSTEELREQIQSHGVSVLVLNVDSNVRRLETLDWIICVREMWDSCRITYYRNPDGFSIDAEQKAQIRKVAESAHFIPNADGEERKRGAFHELLKFGYFQVRKEASTIVLKNRLWKLMDWTD